jgi:hypothetical protein
VAEGEHPRTVGAILRGWRGQRNVSLKEIAGRTRIRMDILQALENDSFEALPAAVYVTGYIRGCARALDQDPAPALEAYAAQTRIPGVEYMPDTNTPIGYDRRPSLRSVGLLVATLVAIVVLINLFVRNYEPVEAGLAAPPTPETTATPAPDPTATLSLIPPFQTRESEPIGDVDDLRFRLVAEMNVSVQVFIDGEPVFTGFMNPGESREWSADDSARLVVNDAGGLRVEIDGTSVGPLGRVGERVEREWSKSDRP